MRKLMVIIIAIMMIASTASAADDTIAQGMGKKAVRGFINLVTGIVELPVQIYKGWENGIEPIENEALSKTTGAIVGIFSGISHAAGRTGWGALELFGFWTANPADNKGVGVPLDAEYAWEKGTKYDIFKPDLKEGLVMPVGKKLVSGAADTFLGIAELPGQAIKGAKEDKPFVGFGKGVWFWLSREAYGVGNLAMFLLPNPEDNPGYAFDSTWPWTDLSEQVK